LLRSVPGFGGLDRRRMAALAGLPALITFGTGASHAALALHADDVDQGPIGTSRDVH
jgi:hypothetical protein